VVWWDKGFDDGDIPGCHSALGDCHLNGNPAEHMNLLLSDERVASGDGTTLDQTEMKGSRLILDSCRAHEDWCWRACRRVSRSASSAGLEII
jgi:hypothetical protein